MPLNLRDLAPFLTPYQAPMSLDLSGVAQHISQNADRAQALQIANQTDATDRAELAEDQRSAQAQEQQARDEAAAAAAKAQHEEEMKLVGQVPAMVDPLAERALRGQMASAGMGVKDTEGRDYGFAPGLEMPGMPAFAEPSVALSTAQPAASPDGDAFINQLDPRGKKGQMLPRDVARNGRLGPLLGDVSEGQDAEFGGFIDALTAPAVEGMAPLGYSPDRTVVTGKDGQELTEFSPVDARGRARLTLDTALDKLLAGSPELSAPIAARAKSMAESTLMAAGYDPQAALDMLVSKTFTPEMQQIYANERSKYNASATTQRTGAGLDLRTEAAYTSQRKEFTSTNRLAESGKMLRSTENVLGLLDSPVGLAQRTAISEHLKALSGLAQTDKERRWITEGAGKMASFETIKNAWTGDAELSPALVGSLKATLKLLQARILRDRLAAAKAFAAQTARSPLFRDPQYKERAMLDVLQYSGEGGEVDGGGNAGGGSSTSTFEARGGAGADDGLVVEEF